MPAPKQKTIDGKQYAWYDTYIGENTRARALKRAADMRSRGRWLTRVVQVGTQPTQYAVYYRPRRGWAHERPLGKTTKR